jgi:hypothetical protein
MIKEIRVKYRIVKDMKELPLMVPTLKLQNFADIDFNLIFKSNKN